MTERTARRPLTRAAVLAAVAVVALAGCSSDPAEDAAASRPRAAEAAPDAPAAELVSTAARRAQDAPSLTLRTTTTIGGSRPSVVTTRSNADASQVSVDAELPGVGSMEARGVDGTFYLRVPGLPDGAEWISLSPDALGGPAASAFGRFVEQDPRLPFAALAEVSSDVTEVGRGQVEGVAATQYRVTIDLADLAGPDAPAWRGPTDLDVWVDEDGSMRQLRYELDGETIDQPGTSVVIESTVLSFDDPVRVEAPPTEATIPFEELLATGDLGALLGALGGN